MTGSQFCKSVIVKSEIILDYKKSMWDMVFSNTVNKYNSDQELLAIFINQLKQDFSMKKILSKKVWDAFEEARDELYPEALEDVSQWTTVYDASNNILEGKLSEFQIKNQAKKGRIRQKQFPQDSFPKVYKPDILIVKTLLKAIDLFSDNLVATKDLNDNDILAVLPMNKSQKMGQSDFEHKAEAVFAILSDPFTQTWVDKYRRKIS